MMRMSSIVAVDFVASAAVSIALTNYVVSSLLPCLHAVNRSCNALCSGLLEFSVFASRFVTHARSEERRG